MKRDISYIVVHCTATPPHTQISSIQHYWQTKLGWKNPGYHYIIKRNGEVVQLQPESRIANGAKGYNEQAVHVSYIGGVDAGNKPADNRNDEQKQALFNMLIRLSERYPSAVILGHRDLPGVIKACPSFDVKKWLATYEPVLNPD